MRIFAPGAVAAMNEWLALIPVSVMHGKVWQVVTYSLLHASFSHVFFNMLTLWFIGAYLESDWGRDASSSATYSASWRRTGDDRHCVYPFSWRRPENGNRGRIWRHFRPADGVRDSLRRSGDVLVSAAVPDQGEVSGWHLVVVAIIAVFEPSQGGVAVFAHLGGLLFGYLWVKFMPSRGMSYAASERFFGARNSYYRWKRKRAARKFEVYMRDHDRKVTFDEHGNYVPPEDDDKTNGGSKSGWVN